MSGTTPGRVDMPRPDGTTRPVPYEEIAELLSHDPVLARLDRDVTVVPVGTGEGDAGLAEAIAARTGPPGPCGCRRGRSGSSTGDRR
ncbi:hypothetical protein L1856_06765 [Streptomyces sp. Tue 6430]|nr:hypothetical protein [Streptomyces sp. Tue 6430]